MIQQSLLHKHAKELKLGSWRDICTFIFTVALFTIPKIWQQPKYPLMDEWIRKLTYIYSAIGPWGHYPRWNKSNRGIREIQLLYDLSSMWNLIDIYYEYTLYVYIYAYSYREQISSGCQSKGMGVGEMGELFLFCFV